MTFDDHYMSTADNKNINMGEYTKYLEGVIGDKTEDYLDKNNTWSELYENILERFSMNPDEPNDNTLICRVFTPEKFLWFLGDMSIYFGGAGEFEDKKDSRIPSDYNNCIQTFLLKRGIIPLTWDAHAELMRSRWLVSCWTKVDDYYGDYLLWNKYAGNSGIGITLRYGDLKKFFQKNFSKENEGEFICGNIDYGKKFRKLPFNKRRFFANEKEIRFVFRASLLASISVDISELKKDIGLRFSPEISLSYVESVREVWRGLGGEDRYHVFGE